MFILVTLNSKVITTPQFKQKTRSHARDSKR